MHPHPASRLARAAVALITIVGAVLLGVSSPATAAGSGTISGRLLAADGSVLEGAGVSAFTLAGSQVAVSSGSLPGGTFSLALPAGQYRLQIDSWNIVGNALTPYWRGATSLAASPIVTVASGQTISVGDVTVPAGASLSGRITTPSGLHLISPMIYASTSAVGTDRQGRVDPSTGDFQVTGLPPGAYVLHLYDQSVPQLLPQYWNGKSTWGEADRVTVAGGEARTGLDFALQPTPTISGTVVGLDAQGSSRPLSGVSVDLLDETGQFVNSTTTYNGAYTLAVQRPGTYKVRFLYYNPNDAAKWQPQWWGDVAFPSQSADVTVSAGAATGGISATMRLGASISGTAAPYSTNAPVGLVDVIAKDPATGLWEIAGRATPTASTGAYSVTGLRPGAYLVRFVDPTNAHTAQYWPAGYTTAEATSITVAQSEARSGVDRAAQSDHGAPGPDRVAATAFVTSAYKDVLDRAPSGRDISYWVGTVLGGAPRAAVASGFNNSDEYRLIKIAAAYQGVLGRAGEATGVQYWLSMMRSGAIQPDDVYRTFLSSNEFYNQQGRGTNEGYITALYQDQVGRAPDARGLSYWVSVLASQGRGVVVNGFWFAAETYRLRVVDAHRFLLGRTPDAREIAAWTAVARANGLTALRTQLMSTDEYYSRASLRF